MYIYHHTTKHVQKEKQNNEFVCTISPKKSIHSWALYQWIQFIYSETAVLGRNFPEEMYYSYQPFLTQH